MRTLVTGASGSSARSWSRGCWPTGTSVRALVRRPISDPRIRAQLQGDGAGPRAGGPAAELVMADALSGVGLERALDGVEVAYYLIHSMQRSYDPAGGATFAERERAAAGNFAAAAQRAGVRRIVYLGGPVVHDRPLSRHLASRIAVERILVDCDRRPDRAARVDRDRRALALVSLLVRLIERMPVLALPAWRSYRTRPIDARDITELLAAGATAAPLARPLDVGGPDVLTYQRDDGTHRRADARRASGAGAA